MLLAVAGLDERAIQERTRDLARGDWSRFTATERAAFAFARKLARPGRESAREFRALVERIGPDHALDVLWWVCHCHYMTCVADALQLPLEGGNVFDGFLASGETPRNP
jgi:hypothetical protein